MIRSYPESVRRSVTRDSRIRPTAVEAVDLEVVIVGILRNEAEWVRAKPFHWLSAVIIIHSLCWVLDMSVKGTGQHLPSVQDTQG